MKLLTCSPEGRWSLPYRNAKPGGGTYWAELIVHEAEVDRLPDGLGAIIATGDLQGRCADGRLLGEGLADELARRADLPPGDAIGVWLAGDLYAAPGAEVRGATGPVDRVWAAFAARTRWVAGVLGNHDEIAGPIAGADVLDGSVVTRDGLRIGGVSGIVGNPNKHNRRDDASYQQAIERVLEAAPDVLLLHESPVGGVGQRGRPAVNEVVAGRVPLVVSGHVHWQAPLATLVGGTQALNVDGRVVILRARE